MFQKYALKRDRVKAKLFHYTISLASCPVHIHSHSVACYDNNLPSYDSNAITHSVYILTDGYMVYLCVNNVFEICVSLENITECCYPTNGHAY